MSSLNKCGSSKISSLVKAQPTPKFFFKAFLELGRKCIISNIADDSKSIAYLLDNSHKEYFNAEFPIFYKN